MIASGTPESVAVLCVATTGVARISGGRRMSCLNLRCCVGSTRQSRSLRRKMDTSRWSVLFTGRKEADKVEAEPVKGGEDLWARRSDDRGRFPEHLVIMVNGLGGSAEDWRFAAEQFVDRLPDKVIVHRSECNSSKLTFDGVDLMGQRLADEVRSVVNNRTGVQKISFVAHSLGGLIARYAIGRLYEPSTGGDSSLAENQSNEEKALEGRIAGLQAMNFITFATPHLGSRGHKQFPILCGFAFLEQRAPKTAHLLVGRTGKHLFLTDNDDGKPPLLLQMVRDNEDVKFISALRTFKRRVLYANANFDHMVGWETSSIRRGGELPQIDLLVSDEKYPHIVYVDKGNTVEVPVEVPMPLSEVETQTNELEDEMVRGLTLVPWERVDVSFHNSKQRYIAHTTIQVKSYWMNSDGTDVVFHMIDNFLV